MIPGSKITPEIKAIVVRLSAILTKENISTYTGISLSSIKRILTYFDQYQTIEVKEEEKEEMRK
jgi:histidyl-tRNA synthetase